MIGHVESGDDEYGLIGEERARDRPRCTVVGATVTLVGLVASVGLLMQGQAQSSSLSLIFFADTEVEVCATKAFGQCSGMNFSSTKDERNLYNFSKAVDDQQVRVLGSTSTC